MTVEVGALASSPGTLAIASGGSVEFTGRWVRVRGRIVRASGTATANTAVVWIDGEAVPFPPTDAAAWDARRVVLVGAPCPGAAGGLLAFRTYRRWSLRMTFDRWCSGKGCALHSGSLWQEVRVSRITGRPVGAGEGLVSEGIITLLRGVDLARLPRRERVVARRVLRRACRVEGTDLRRNGD